MGTSATVWAWLCFVACQVRLSGASVCKAPQLMASRASRSQRQWPVRRAQHYSTAGNAVRITVTPRASTIDTTRGVRGGSGIRAAQPPPTPWLTESADSASRCSSSPLPSVSTRKYVPPGVGVRNPLEDACAWVRVHRSRSSIHPDSASVPCRSVPHSWFCRDATGAFQDGPLQ